MMKPKDCRLIVVEGLPCSGKSTTAAFLAKHCGMTFVDEGTGDHPADWECHALLSESEYQQALSMLRGEKAIRDFSCNTERLQCGYAVRLSDAYPPALQELLDQREIYDELPWKKEKPAMREKWQMFVDACDRGYVFNCVLLQNPMCETMMRFNMPRSESAEYIGEICEIIRPLHLLIVYLQNDRIADSIRSALPDRGEDWLNAVIGYHCGGGYGRAQGLHGFDGYIAALEERQRRELFILETLPVPHLLLRNPQENWAAAYDTLRAQL